MLGYAHVLRSCLLLGLAIGLPLLAGAQVNVGTSFNPVGSGARAMGQGNAFIAVADDATAASWNPAGIAQLERPECSLAWQYWHNHGQIGAPTHPEAESDHVSSLADLNYASLVYPINLDGHNLALSLNYLKMYGFDQEMKMLGIWSDPFMTVTDHYSLQQEGALSVLAPAIAMDVTDSLAVGFTFNIWNDDITQGSSYRKQQKDQIDMQSGLQYGQEFMTREDQFDVENGYSVVLGLLYSLNKHWMLGAVIKPPFSLRIRHTKLTSGYATGDFESPFTQEKVLSDASLDMPLVIGTGVAWRPCDPLTVSMDVSWTQWSHFVMREKGFASNPISNKPLKDGRCTDLYSVRAGAEYIIPFEKYQLPLRCGFGYDPAPGIGKADDFYTANIGAGIQWSRYALDFAYEVRWGRGVNTGMLSDIGAEDVIQHRMLLSLIVYM